jgi:hypothetical protein
MAGEHGTRSIEADFLGPKQNKNKIVAFNKNQQSNHYLSNVTFSFFFFFASFFFSFCHVVYALGLGILDLVENLCTFSHCCCFFPWHISDSNPLAIVLFLCQ